MYQGTRPIECKKGWTKRGKIVCRKSSKKLGKRVGKKQQGTRKVHMQEK